MGIRRVFIIVLDSFGCGALPDASAYGDEGSDTLRSVTLSKCFRAPFLTSLGLFNIFGNREKSVPAAIPVGAYGRAAERSAGKDTTTGHWEIAGLVSKKPMPTYPDGFPEELIQKIEKETGVGILCNKPYSGTEVIKDYGREHIVTGKPIVYTSADSVFQVAAHEDVMPLEKLYEYCKKVRALLVGENAVGRVIARPFKGEYPNYERTPYRHDYSVAPPEPTLLDYLKSSGFDVIGVGKIGDIFAMSGLTESIPTHGNEEGMKAAFEAAGRNFTGLCFVNLVDFDSLYGHRNNSDGYAKAISEFDAWLGDFLKKLNDDDLLLITADHGCDPATSSTDHSREYVPIIAYGAKVCPCDLGTRTTYADIGKTVADIFSVENDLAGESFAGLLGCETLYGELAQKAIEMRKMSYSPYSGFRVGAALLTREGKVYGGCNIENSAYPATCCAERTAFYKALSEGKRNFSALAIAGGKEPGDASELASYCAPCGTCRQVIREFCGGNFRIISVKSKNDYKIYTLDELLPFSFGPDDLG